MEISRHNLTATSKRLVGANSGHIKLNIAVFLNLTVADTTSSQMVYVTPQVTCLFLSQKACKELCAMHPYLPAQATGTDKISAHSHGQ